MAYTIPNPPRFVKIIGLILAVLVFPVLIFFRPSDVTLVRVFQLLRHPFVEDLSFNVLQARTSLQKTANIIHFPYWFKESTLPQYKIYLPTQDIGVLNQALPSNVFADNLLSENKVFVPAVFSSNGYTQEVDVRYRGALNTHWSHAKRSLLIKFSSENLFETMKSIDLIVPRDRVYMMAIINNDRLKRHGLKPINLFFSWVVINDRDAGVYLVKERFSKGWLEKNMLPDDSEVFSQTSAAAPEIPTYESGLVYKTWRRDIDEINPSFEELETLFAVLQLESDPEFKKNIGNILDVEKWYRAIAINVLAGGPHSLDVNLNLLFNPATGLLEPLLEDIHIYPSPYATEDYRYEDFDSITQRILSIPDFYEQYRQVLVDVSADKNLQADLESFDEIYATLKPSLYKDQSKYRSDLQMNREIRNIRSWMVENYAIAQELAEIDVVKSPVSDSPAELTVLSGNMRFRKNVIIPAGTNLTIEPGTILSLDSGVSIISYSPVIAIGTPSLPIRIQRSQEQEAWGSFAVINVSEESSFNYVYVDGGSSSEKINRVTFTGMLSAHNAPIVIRNSRFSKDSDDDMVNVKFSTGSIRNSQFINSTGDAIDLDMTENFEVTGNTFTDIGGDAVDLSWSDAKIFENTITDCVDKGISVGEKSKPHIVDNVITKCAIGIAVKDLSDAVIEENTITDNETGIALYQKKDIFGGATATLRNNDIESNQVNVDVDEKSHVTYEQ